MLHKAVYSVPLKAFLALVSLLHIPIYSQWYTNICFLYLVSSFFLFLLKSKYMLRKTQCSLFSPAFLSACCSIENNGWLCSLLLNTDWHNDGGLFCLGVTSLDFIYPDLVSVYCWGNVSFSKRLISTIPLRCLVSFNLSTILSSYLVYVLLKDVRMLVGGVLRSEGVNAFCRLRKRISVAGRGWASSGVG